MDLTLVLTGKIHMLGFFIARDRQVFQRPNILFVSKAVDMMGTFRESELECICTSDAGCRNGVPCVDNRPFLGNE